MEKRIVSIVLGTIVAISLVIVGIIVGIPYATFSVNEETGGQTIEETAEMPNPFTECTTIEEAQKLAGFNMTIPKAMPEGYSRIVNISQISNYPSWHIPVSFIYWK